MSKTSLTPHPVALPFGSMLVVLAPQAVPAISKWTHGIFSSTNSFKKAPPAIDPACEPSEDPDVECDDNVDPSESDMGL